MEELDQYISDADRERAVWSLRDHLVAGRLTLEEFSERVGAAYSACVGRELALAQEGLPDFGGAAALSPRAKPTRADDPIIRVRAFSLFGTVDLWRVPPEMRGDYGEIFRQLQQRQRQLPAS